MIRFFLQQLTSILVMLVFCSVGLAHGGDTPPPPSTGDTSGSTGSSNITAADQLYILETLIENNPSATGLKVWATSGDEVYVKLYISQSQSKDFRCPVNLQQNDFDCQPIN